MFKNLKRWWRYNPPSFATSEGWNNHDSDFKKNAPIRYFFNETLDDFLLKYWHWPIWSPLKNRYQRLRNRILPWRRPHIVNTGLAPDYHDKDHLILHANFAILVDFVEREKAWMEYFCNGDKKNYPPIRWYNKPFFRNREMGITYLDWEATLDDPTHPNYQSAHPGQTVPQKIPKWHNGHPSQAEAARQVKRLYIWWKDDYSKRVDPYGLPDLTHLDLIALEEKEANEEQEALIMLMKIRKSLWT